MAASILPTDKRILLIPIDDSEVSRFTHMLVMPNACFRLSS